MQKITLGAGPSKMMVIFLGNAAVLKAKVDCPFVLLNIQLCGEKIKVVKLYYSGKLYVPSSNYEVHGILSPNFNLL